ncbi:DUF1285 domain-containing protein [Yunchengibacter salinarum]|uniref:DUF1285 domain-containing protein n=1 Tax=Yunchengibacter salinarum TaxID=3133399 RepID=UPI0035B67143
MTAARSLNDIMAEIGTQSRPPVHRWNPPFCGDIDMRIARDGRWFYMGSPIGRQRMVKLFASVLRKDSDGGTYLVTPVEKLGITVDDAPFTIVRLDRHETADGPVITATTNLDEQVVLDDEHPLWVHHDDQGQPRPYVRVRDRLDGLLVRSAFYDLVAMAEPERHADGDHLMVDSAGARFDLGCVEAVEA